MSIGKRVIVSIPATEAEVQAANAGIVIVHDDNLCREFVKSKASFLSK